MIHAEGAIVAHFVFKCKDRRHDAIDHVHCDLESGVILTYILLLSDIPEECSLRSQL